MMANHPDKGGTPFILEKIDDAYDEIDYYWTKMGYDWTDMNGIHNYARYYEPKQFTWDNKFDLIIESHEEETYADWAAMPEVNDLPTPRLGEPLYYDLPERNPHLVLDTAPWAYIDSLHDRWNKKRKQKFNFWKGKDPQIPNGTMWNEKKRAFITENGFPDYPTQGYTYNYKHAERSMPERNY